MKKIVIILTIVFWLIPFLINAQNYRNADLPDAMTFLDGRRVETKADLQARKEEIKNLWCDYIIGHYPEKAPELLSAELLELIKDNDGSVRKRIKLTFDTPNRKSFEIEVWIPDTTGPFPLLLTQPRYYQIPWGEEALKRGYIVCLYPGLDTHHSEKDYPGYQDVWKEFKDEYPKASWSSSLGVQAWLASRTLDYLLNQKYEYNIDTTAVGIIGHSRYGKQSIYAAAFDKRFKCVIARSSGSPTACGYRFASRQTFMESVSDEDCPQAWVLPELSDYYGRENELPVEGNALLATIAPRHLMLHTAYNDGCDPTFGVERNYLNAKKAYTFLGKEENIRLIYREGNHNPMTAEHVRINLDFFDLSFGRGTTVKTDFPEKLLHRFDWQSWKKRQQATDLKIPREVAAKEKIKWMLGNQPDVIDNEGQYYIKTGEELGVNDWSRDRWNPGDLKRVPFSFSGKMNGNIYFDPKIKQHKATVIWLHPWNYSHGSNESYGVQGTTIYWRLAQEGYIVVAYDQFGFGDHLLDAVGFYEKYPHWSKLGRAVYDVKKVMDFLVDGKGITSEDVPETDPSRIYICGFSFGGMVGLYATALDKRIAGVASFSGFTPMRTDTDRKSTGGIRQYFEWHAILPKLGLFDEKEDEIPYDYDDVIKMIAPRSCLIYAPTRDRFTDPDDIKECVKKVKMAWDDTDNFMFKSPDDICRFQKDQQNIVVEWLEKQTGKYQAVAPHERARKLINKIDPLDQYNVSWDTPGNISNNSMPAGNGDIGINLWVEEKGDVVFYLSKTDAWSENARLLKPGCIRLSLSPNPFQPGMNYHQELQLKDGLIKIEAGDKTNPIEIIVWADAHHPVVEIDVRSKQPVNAKVKIDIWRNRRRQLVGDEIHSAYGLSGEFGPDVFIEPDTVLAGEEHELIWMHRNRRSVWSDNLKLQALGEWTETHNDPLLNRTFGGVIQCNKMKRESNTTLYTEKAETKFSVSVYALTAQTETIEEWTGLLKKTIQQTEGTPREERLNSHQEWWRTFWERSYIHISTDDSTARENIHAINQGYILQRYMNACSGRGRFPIKFNGSIFTVDTKNLKGKYEGYDADYRQWGGPYWWQNTRLPYWSMPAAGDFDLMKPLFKMYFEALPLRKFATEEYYEHPGAFFPETMYFWGTYVDANYGRDRAGKPDGLTDNGYIRRYWQGGLEISLLMLDYYAYTGNEVFVSDTLVPFVSEILKFFDQHWERDKNGEICFDPAQSLETWWTAVNPLPEIVGIEKVASGMLNLPQQFTTQKQQSDWKKLINDLPDVPLREENGQKLLAPAESYGEKRNSENTELYAIFPYRMFGVGKPDLEIARHTFSARTHKVTGGWQQSAIQSAYLGLADEAADLVTQNFTVVPEHYRFPAMWGPNYDWTPDQCHGTVAMTALQRMLIQCDGEKIYLFPAWPKEWNVDFKLYAPFNTIIEGSYKQGEIVKLRVDPEYRRNDVEIIF